MLRTLGGFFASDDRHEHFTLHLSYTERDDKNRFLKGAAGEKDSDELLPLYL